MPNDPLHPTLGRRYLAGVLVAITACSKKLGRDPDEATVAFGTTAEQEPQRPNFRVTGAGRPFIFQGGNHKPYSPRTQDLSNHVEGRFREGSFSGQNLTGEYRFGDVAAAAGARPEDPGLSAYTGACRGAMLSAKNVGVKSPYAAPHAVSPTMRRHFVNGLLAVSRQHPRYITLF